MILFRWMSVSQARQVLTEDEMRPSWRHLLPEGEWFGTCLSPHPVRWADDDPGRRVMLALDCTDLMESVDTRPVDGDLTWALTRQHDAARERSDGEAMEAVMARISEVDVPFSRASEVFVTAPVGDVASRLRGIAIVVVGREPGTHPSAEHVWGDEMSDLSDVEPIVLSPGDLRELHHPGEMEMLVDYLARSMPNAFPAIAAATMPGAAP